VKNLIILSLALLLNFLVGCEDSSKIEKQLNNNSNKEKIEKVSLTTIEELIEEEEIIEIAEMAVVEEVVEAEVIIEEVPNTPPTITGLISGTISEGEIFSVTPEILDADGDELIITAIDLPNNSYFLDGELRFEPDFTQSGQYEVVIVVDDGEVMISQIVTITVDDLNQAPVLDEIPAQTAVEAQAYTLTITASDIDDNDLVYSASSLPMGATFIDGVFNWTPNCR